jgi:putative photosynthetic complex assembly protein
VEDFAMPPDPRSSRLARLPGLAIGGMIAIALAGATVGSFSHHGATLGEHGAPVAQRDLRFADRADGAILIYDGASTTPFDVLQGENGFIRGTLRGIARKRKEAGLDSSLPFHLAAWPDGRLTLDDPATGTRVELEAFGGTNAGAFAHLLPGLGGGG